jgi:hypothetical protein
MRTPRRVADAQTTPVSERKRTPLLPRQVDASHARDAAGGGGKLRLRVMVNGAVLIDHGASSWALPRGARLISAVPPIMDRSVDLDIVPDVPFAATAFDIKLHNGGAAALWLLDDGGEHLVAGLDLAPAAATALGILVDGSIIEVFTDVGTGSRPARIRVPTARGGYERRAISRSRDGRSVADHEAARARPQSSARDSALAKSLARAPLCCVPEVT